MGNNTVLMFLFLSSDETILSFDADSPPPLPERTPESYVLANDEGWFKCCGKSTRSYVWPSSVCFV